MNRSTTRNGSAPPWPGCCRIPRSPASRPPATSACCPWSSRPSAVWPTAAAPRRSRSWPAPRTTAHRSSTSPSDCRGLKGTGQLDLEPGVLKVEVALDPVHHVVADHALVAELDDGAALGLEQLAHQPLPGARPVLVAVVLDFAGLRLEAPVLEVVGTPEPLHGIVVGPVLGGQLLQPRQRRVRRDQTPLQLLPLLAAVAVHVQAADQHGQ